MAYNTSKGTRDLGDIQNENDKDTQIDFGSDQIALKTNNIDRLVVTNDHVSCSVNISGSKFYGDGSTLNLGNTGVSADAYTYTSLTVNAEGRITAASSGTPPALTFVGNQAANRVITSDGGGQANAEANLTFDGNNLKLNGLGQITGSLELTGSGQSLLTLHTRDADSLKEIAFLKDGTPAAAIQINDAEHLFIENENQKDIILRANNQNALRVIGSQRRVIVGTVSKTTANAQLDVEGNATISGSFVVSGSGPNHAAQRKTVIDQTHVSSSLNISGSDFYASGVKLEPSPVTSYTNAGSSRLVTSTNSSTINGQPNLTFNALNNTLSVTGNTSVSNDISASHGIHVTGSDPHISIGARRGTSPNAIMLNVKPGEGVGEAMNNKILALFSRSESTDQRTILAVTGSGKVAVGGAHLSGLLNISGSSSEILFSAKSDSHNPALTLRGNGNASISGSLTVSGSLRAKQLHMTTHKYDADGTNAVFVRFDANGAETTAGDNNKMAAPYSGQLIKVVVRGTAAGGSTVASMHRNVDGNQNLDSTALESITVNMANANTSYTFNFTDDADYGPGDIVGIKINPSSDPGIVVATAVWEFDHNG